MPPGELRIVVPRYGDSVVGGSEGLARRLAGALSARGWSIEVWSTMASDEATWAGRLPPVEVGSDRVRVRRFAVAARRPPRLFHQVSRAMFRLPARARPESLWVRLQGPYAPSLARALAAAPARPTLFTPYLYYTTLCGLPAAPHPRLLMPAAHDERPFRLRAVGRTIAAADALWYHTPEERDLVEALHPEARHRPHAVGTVGVDLGTVGDPGRFRERSGIRGPILAFGGRTAPGKGFDVLDEGFRLLRDRRPDVTLVVAGDRPPAVGPGVVAVGRLALAEWLDCVAAAFAVVVPGTMESLSMLALEAWVARKPCLVNEGSPVLAGQARRSGGALTFAGPQGLADAALRLLDDPPLAELLGQTGHAYVEGAYRWEDVAERLADLILRAGHTAS